MILAELIPLTLVCSAAGSFAAARFRRRRRTPRYTSFQEWAANELHRPALDLTCPDCGLRNGQHKGGCPERLLF
jgi:hypothetical protein